MFGLWDSSQGAASGSRQSSDTHNHVFQQFRPVEPVASEQTPPNLHTSSYSKPVDADRTAAGKATQHFYGSESSLRSVLDQGSEMLVAIVVNPIGAAVLGVTLTGTSALVWWRYFRRIQTADYVTPSVLKFRKKLVGRVISVGDADGFRFYHTPGPPILRELMYPWPPRGTMGKRQLVKQSISIRIAGVDAPESGHFGKPAQPFAKEAKEYLTAMVRSASYESKAASHNKLRLGTGVIPLSSFFSSSKTSETNAVPTSATIATASDSRLVYIYPSHIDQYKRLVATPFVWNFPYVFGKTNISLSMVQQGLATVYRSAGADYGRATWWAKYWRKSTSGFNALERAEAKAK